MRNIDIPTHERYIGSNTYVEQFSHQELSKYAQKSAIALPKMKHIEREPYDFRAKPQPAYRNDKTEYKQAFNGPDPNLKHAAGKRLDMTHIGDW